MRFSTVATSVALAVTCLSVSAAEVRLNGATTVVNRVINPYQAEVEKNTRHTLVVVGNATGRGLVDLVSGKCDASMTSEPLEIAAAAADAAGKQVDPSKLVMTLVKTDEIVFVVHKSNPVKTLSWAQVRDIYTGKISNWKEVGGKDAPIALFVDEFTGGTRAMIKKVVLGGKEYDVSATAVPSVKVVAEQVAIKENGFGGVGMGFVDSAKVSVVDTAKLERPLGFITVGKPTGNVAAVIKAFQDAAKKQP
ncbi:MAG TPA: substrate-binding domain-containing protein [Rhodocyclaceae bacterium]|nr:substrate-binding domain-containing protein [Rhodocyclaceae bacterium]